ncbi:hypothetical protein MFFDBJGM_01268 [Pectobacterium versatile]|nr:hypothetical protein MFFDBJGM_01268 [Pectobacterium versatile]
MRRHLARRVNLISPQHNPGLVGIQPSINLRGAGYQAEVVTLARVQPLPGQRDIAALHVDMLQVPLRVQLRFTGGQRHLRGIDKAAAVAGNAVRVGNNHAGLLATDFQVARQRTAVGGDHFVDNGVGGVAFQIGVVLDQPAELGRIELFRAVI